MAQPSASTSQPPPAYKNNGGATTAVISSSASALVSVENEIAGLGSASLNETYAHVGGVTSPTCRTPASTLAQSVASGLNYGGPTTVSHSGLGPNVAFSPPSAIPPSMASNMGPGSSFWQNPGSPHVLPVASAAAGGAMPFNPYAFMQGQGYQPNFPGAPGNFWGYHPFHGNSSLSRPVGQDGMLPPLPNTPLPPLPPQSGMQDGATSVASEEVSLSDLGESTPQFPISDAIDRLVQIAALRVADGKVKRTSSRSAAEADLGMGPAGSSAGPCLTESPMMADILDECLTTMRGGAGPPGPGTVPSCPSASPLGTFLKADKLPFDHKRFACSAIPSGSAPLSQGDLALLNEADRSASRLVTLKEKTVSDWEETSRRGLMAVSAMDSFLSGLIRTFKEGNEGDPFALKEEIDTDDLLSFFQAVTKCMRFAAGSLASLQVNFALARRDAVLSKSQVLSNDTILKNSLRSLPLSSDSLFGGDHVSASIHSLAETRRDMAFAVPRPMPKPAGQGSSHSGKHKPSTQSQGSSRTQRKKSVFPKSKGGKGKPYERPQAPKAQPKPSPQ